MTDRGASRFLALAVLMPAAAFAAGTNIPDQGAAAAGRGGAFAADASDASALYYNPAGLAQQKGFSFDVDLSLFNHQVSFLRSNANGSTLPNEVTAQNTAGFFPLPMLALSYGTEVAGRTLAIGLGAYGPSAVGRYQYPTPDYSTDANGNYTNNPIRDAPQRYTLVDNNLLIFYPTLSAAYFVLPKSPERPVWLSVALSLQYVYSQLHIEQAVFNAQSIFFSGSPPGCDPTVAQSCGPQRMQDENPQYDALATVDVKGRPLFTGSASALLGIGDRLQIGAFFQLGYHLHDTGTINLDLSNLNNSLGVGAVQSGNSVTLDLNLPSIGRLGVMYRVLPTLKLELDAVYEGWGTSKRIVVTPTDVHIYVKALNQTQTPQPIVQTVNFQDSISVRLGGEYGFELGLPWKVRAGAIYETSAVPEQQTRIDFPDLGGVYLSAGLGAALGPVEVNLAFAYGLPTQRTVTDSTLLMPTGDPNLKPAVVGNGTYTSSVIHVALSVAGHFGG